MAVVGSHEATTTFNRPECTDHEHPQIDQLIRDDSTDDLVFRIDLASLTKVAKAFGTTSVEVRYAAPLHPLVIRPYKAAPYYQPGGAAEEDTVAIVMPLK